MHASALPIASLGATAAVLTLLLLIGGGLLWLNSQRSVPTTTTATAETPAPVSAAVDGRPSIAVLPFDNRSRLEDNAFFVDGIHDDVLTQLSKVSALRVISRTSVEQFRDTKLPIRAIADQLGVTKILEGGVERAGDRVRVTVQRALLRFDMDDAPEPLVHLTVVFPWIESRLDWRHDRNEAKVECQLACLVALVGTIHDEVNRSIGWVETLEQSPSFGRVVRRARRQAETTWTR